MNKIRSLSVAFTILVAATAIFAHQPAPHVYTAEDYARAEKMLGYNTAPLVDRYGVRPTFLDNGQLWYRVLTPTGTEYVLINPVDGSRRTASTLEKLGLPNAKT